MEKKRYKVVEFVKNHKKEIVVGVAGAASLICGIVYFSKGKQSDILIDNWSVGTLTNCWREGGCINVIANDFTVADAGKLGKELLKIDGVTMNTPMDVVLSVPDIKVD